MRQLTEAELEQSEVGPSFAGVTAEQLFSARSDFALASRVQRTNPRRYLELRQEWQFVSGAEPRPSSYWDAPQT
jgi:hypothetical protein